MYLHRTKSCLDSAGICIVIGHFENLHIHWNIQQTQVVWIKSTLLSVSSLWLKVPQLQIGHLVETGLFFLDSLSDVWL